jgi:hypothetical protein
MKKIYLVTFILFISSFIYAQDKIEIGKTIGNEYLISADTSILRKAMQRTLGDGTQFFEFRIESVNAFHYLIGVGMLKGHYKMMAAQLQYDMKTRSFFAAPLLPHVTCSSAACENCKPFKENGKIIGCKCEEKLTVSNQCNFNLVEQSLFYDNVKRYLEMKR